MLFFKRMIVHIRTLLLMQRLYPHLILSYKHRLYLIHILFSRTQATPLPLSIAYSVRPSRGLVVEPSRTNVLSLDADCPLLKYLGFNLILSQKFISTFVTHTTKLYKYSELQEFPAIQCLCWACKNCHQMLVSQHPYQFAKIILRLKS